MLVLDALFDHIQQISSHVEINPLAAFRNFAFDGIDSF
jgi:hypothetical protein